MQHLTNLTHEEKMQLSVPMVVRGGVIKYSQCLMYKRDYANLSMKDVKSILLTNSSGVEQKECHSWTYDTSQYKSSIVSQVSSFSINQMFTWFNLPFLVKEKG